MSKTPTGGYYWLKYTSKNIKAAPFVAELRKHEFLDSTFDVFFLRGTSAILQLQDNRLGRIEGNGPTANFQPVYEISRCK